MRQAHCLTCLTSLTLLPSLSPSPSPITSLSPFLLPLQVDVGGLPSGLVNFVSKRQPLAVAYLRDYLVSTSLDLSIKVTSSTSSNC